MFGVVGSRLTLVGARASLLAQRATTTAHRQIAISAFPTPPPPTNAQLSLWQPNISSYLSDLLQSAVWFIKRTYQPSIIRKRRKTGFLKRHKSVGGRRTLRRRFNKGRARLGGC
mmetsp:Transcript_3927/g.4698  ORF Transcript_3927/g.4698 Transcript_3927/m.4698 type:complete len:114 (-) Transcript_3927:224-565(-)